MEIAYLMLCHKNPEQVSTLIKTLLCDHTDFYIHVDKKVSAFELPDSEHIHVVPEQFRIDVRWASISMITATLALIDCMLHSGKQYDYVFLISGQDFPIKSNSQIVSFLTENRGKNFIEVLPHTNPLYKRYSKRNAIKYPNWMFGTSSVVKALRKLYIYLSGGYSHTFAGFARKNSTGLSFEFGSQWWCLTFDCVKWIRNYINEHSHVLSFFDYSLTPDECLFQTVFMASPYKNSQCDKITYLEWDTGNNHPRILTLNDLLLLNQTDCLFARKFDSGIDKSIIEKLNELLNEV